MNAIILAAGKGERLLPLTKNNPKCMVKLFEKSLIEIQIDTLQKCGISDISIVTGYCHEKISFPNLNYFHNHVYDKTNMVETLFCAKEKFTDSTIISYGDIVFEKQVLEKLIDSNDDVSVVVDMSWEKYWKIRFENILDDAESLILENGYIKNIGQRVDSLKNIHAQYIGLMKFQNNGISILQNYYNKMKKFANDNGINPLNSEIPFEKSFMTDFLQGLIKENYKIKSVPIENGWLELDTIHDFEIYQKKIKNNTISEFYNLKN
ncbi:NTP transferase domain-containing protein [Nitrosopumilus sp.]|uniref:phosphocholine cytidylyltransferase family protein n=1 Tax=Nitrosopumilus sp. TaxID=2024843 RepID=UPI003D0EF71C